MADMTPGQRWSPEGYQHHASFVAELGSTALDLLAPRPGERILDLGCGDGRLTEKLGASGASVLGVDASPELLDAARRRGLDAQWADGQALTFDRAFDAVFSNAALHWMAADPAAVLAGVHRALKPGGRFVGEMGGHGNVAAVVTALLAALCRRGIDGRARFPWYFPSAEAYAERLTAAGFVVETIGLHPRPTPLPTGIQGWLETFAGPFLVGLEPAVGAAVLAEAADLLAFSLRDDRGRWSADYVRLRFRAWRA